MASRAAEPALSPEQEQLLRSTAISDAAPGSILRDFQVLLDFIGPAGVEVAGQHHLFPMRLLGDLNARMAQPFAVRLARPQLRSYPNLQGLWLLLRATGLGVIRGAGAKARLVLDEDLLRSWRALNPTERYFNLLEAWLLYARTEVLGEHGSDEMLFDVLRRWEDIPKRGRKLDTDPNNRSFALYHAYHLALMHLFGFAEIQWVEPRPGGPWKPTFVRPLAVGQAVFTLLRLVAHATFWGEPDQDEQPDESGEDEGQEETGAAPDGQDSHDTAAHPGDGDEPVPADDQEEEDGSAEEEDFDDEVACGTRTFGIWQAVFDEYFPQWQNNLTCPPAPFREGQFIFRASLEKAWRRISIRADGSLADLAACILRAFRFDDEHLYEFSYPGRFGQTVTVAHPYCDEGLPADLVRVGRLPLEEGESMVFQYDFGEDWEFTVTLERVGPLDPKRRKPVVIESVGKAPRQHPDWE